VVAFPFKVETQKLAGRKIALTAANAEGEHYKRVKYDCSSQFQDTRIAKT